MAAVAYNDMSRQVPRGTSRKVSPAERLCFLSCAQFQPRASNLEIAMDGPATDLDLANLSGEIA
jgi:hypothetical protein